MVAWVKRWRVIPPQTFFLRALLTISAALLPALLGLAVLGHLYSDSERRVIEAHRDDVAASAALIIEREVAERIGALEALTSTYRELAANPEKFHQIVRSAAAKLDEAIVLLNREGVQLFSTRFSSGQALPRREDMSPVDPVFEQRSPYVSDIVIGTASRVPLVFVSVPIMANGDADLALSATVSSSNLSRTLLETGLQKGWITAIIDRKGLFIARSEGGPDYLGKPARAELIKVAAGVQTAGTFSNITHEGVPVESSFRKSKLTGWTVVVMERGESMQFEEPFTGVNGRRTFLSTKTPWRNQAGEIIGIVGVSTDITERERRTQHVEFVMRELSHRSKNLLTIIQSIAQ
jgi:PAS domain-containing protein